MDDTEKLNELAAAIESATARDLCLAAALKARALAGEGATEAVPG